MKADLFLQEVMDTRQAVGQKPKGKQLNPFGGVLVELLKADYLTLGTSQVEVPRGQAMTHV